MQKLRDKNINGDINFKDIGIDNISDIGIDNI